MKKRINLTDGELAVGMWTYILLFVENWHGSRVRAPSIAGLKLKYLLSHGKDYDYWENDCYLCNKYSIEGRCTCKCPLNKDGSRCGVGSTWWRACEYSFNKGGAIEAIKEILEIMKKEAEKDERKVRKEGK